MNIGFFYPRYYPLTASASVHGYYLANELIRRGHTLLSATADENPACVRFPATPAGLVRLAMRAEVLYIRLMDYYERVALAKWIKPLRLPVVWEINAPEEELLAADPADPGLRRRVAERRNRRRQWARLVDACVCVSDPLAAYVRATFGIRKVFCVPNGSDPLLFEKQRPLPLILENFADRFKVVWAGNPALPWQAVDYILKLADHMAAVDSQIVFIVLCGEGQWRASARSNIIVVPQVPYHTIPDYLVSADCCLCLYHPVDWSSCGFYHSPLKLFDYMAAGKPIIASRLGQIATIIRDGQNGMLTDNSFEELVSLLQKLKAQPLLRQQIGDTARRDVQRYYNWQRVGAQVDAVLRSVVGRNVP